HPPFGQRLANPAHVGGEFVDVLGAQVADRSRQVSAENLHELAVGKRPRVAKMQQVKLMPMGQYLLAPAQDRVENRSQAIQFVIPQQVKISWPAGRFLFFYRWGFPHFLTGAWHPGLDFWPAQVSAWSREGTVVAMVHQGSRQKREVRHPSLRFCAK